MTRNYVETEEPTIIRQIPDTDELDPGTELDVIEFETRAGDRFTLVTGETLCEPNGSAVGQITELTYVGRSWSTESHDSAVRRTVTIDHEAENGATGGIPLGEIAVQFEEGELTTS